MRESSAYEQYVQKLRNLLEDFGDKCPDASVTIQTPFGNLMCVLSKSDIVEEQYGISLYTE